MRLPGLAPPGEILDVPLLASAYRRLLDAQQLEAQLAAAEVEDSAKSPFAHRGIGHDAAAELTTGGLLFMVLSWGAIVALCVFCFAKILKNRD